MPSSDQEISERETQFVEQSGDEDALYEVIEITEERAKTYRVKWAGVDPKTRKPWPQSWVSKHDCTDKLVMEWKMKKKRKDAAKSKDRVSRKNENGNRRSKSGQSATSKASSSVASASSRPRTRAIVSLVSDDGSPSLGEGSFKLRGASKDSFAQRSAKRKRTTSDFSDHSLPFVVELSPRAKKKRKTSATEEATAKDSTQSTFQMPRGKYIKVVGSDGDEGVDFERHGEKKNVTVTKPPRYMAGVEDGDDLDNSALYNSRTYYRQEKGKERERSPDIFDAEEDEEDKEEPLPSPPITKTGPPKNYRKKVNTKGNHSISHVKSKKASTEVSDADSPNGYDASVQRASSFGLRTKQPSGNSAAKTVPGDAVEPLAVQHKHKKADALPDSSSPSVVAVDTIPPALSSNALATSIIPDVTDKFADKISENETYNKDVLDVPNFDFDKLNGADFGDDLMQQDLDIPPSLPPIIFLSHSTGEQTDVVLEPGELDPRRDTNLDDSGSIVPETDTQPSINPTSQEERSKQNAGSVDTRNRAAKSPSGRLLAPIRSQMKSKSAGGSDLHSIRQVSPSVFRPFVKPASPSNDCPPSSIEEFSSPEKSGKAKAFKKSRNNYPDDTTIAEETVDDYLEGDAVQKRGAELALEASRHRTKGKEDIGTKSKRVNLTEVVKRFNMQRRENSGARSSNRSTANLGGPTTGSSAHPGGRGPSESSATRVDTDLRRSEPEAIQQMGDAYVDWDGGLSMDDTAATATADTVDASVDMPRQIVPQEEEESTQDLLLEQQQRQQRDRQLNNDTITTEWSSQAVGPEETEDSIEVTQRMVEISAPSGSPTASAPKPILSQIESQEHPCSQEDPQSQPGLEPASTSAELQTDNVQIGSSMALLQPAQPGNDELMRLLHEAQESARAEALSKTILQQELSDLRTQHSSEKAEWDEESARLQASLSATAKQKANADEAVELFRTQYFESSSFVTRVQKENRELEQRALIAEGQTRDGVAMIRASFESRTETLSEELRKWKALAELLQEKDSRTNDDIRRLAAETPELIAQNAELNARLNDLEDVVDDVDRERASFKKEVDRLNAEKLQWMQERETERQLWLGELASLRKANPMQPIVNGDDESKQVCMWRIGVGDEERLCLEPLDNVEALAKHAKAHVEATIPAEIEEYVVDH